MRRGLVAYLLFFLSLGLAKGQPAITDCARFTGGTFIKGNFSDSIVVFRGLEYWIEADLKAHECRVYKIVWTDACNFMLLFNNSIDEDKRNNLRKKKQDSIFYTTDSFDSAQITYKTYTSKNDIRFGYEKLRPFTDSLAWEYLVSADSNTYFDTSEIKQLYGLPAQNYSLNTPTFISLQMDSADTYLANYIAYLLKGGDLRPAFSFASLTLKAHSPQAVLDDYNEYVRHLVGRLKAYTVASIRVGFKLNKRYTRAYIIKGDFEKLGTGASICLTSASGNKNPLQSLSIAIDSANLVPFINDLSHSFFEDLKHKRYRKLYDSSSTLLKSDLSRKEAENIFKSIDSGGHLDDYKVFFQNFTVIKERGLLLISYKCPLQGKALVINLFYAFEAGEYKLSGINSSKG